MRYGNRRLFFFGCLLAVLFAVVARASERSFTEETFEKGELRYVNDLPVLIVAGTPDEMGRQKAALTGNVIPKIEEYPKRLLEIAKQRSDSPKNLSELAKTLAPQIPEDHRAEIRAFAKQTGREGQWELGVLANVMVDIYRGGFACSSIMVDAEHSTTHGPLFGRNLDFYTLGIIDPYSLVTVHRPVGKHAFATIGFPGLFGCVSGMNDAGLAIAVHEVFLSRDKAAMFNPEGVPYTFCFRRILEECSTVEEAEKLLRSMERTTILSLAICDKKKAAVFEMTPKTVAVRTGEDGVCLCTNHFRSPELAAILWCRRYRILSQSRYQLPLGVEEIAEKLDRVNMGKLTVHSMIFEPDPLLLHLSIGPAPASSQPMKKIELEPLFKPETIKK